MGESDDSEERTREIVREVIDERETKIKLLQLIDEVADKRESTDRIRRIAKTVYWEYLGIVTIVGGIVSSVIGLSLPTLLPALASQIIVPSVVLIVTGLLLIMIGYSIYTYSKKKFRELSRKYR